MLSLPNLLLKYQGFSKISKCDKLIGLIKKLPECTTKDLKIFHQTFLIWIVLILSMINQTMCHLKPK